MDDHQTETEGTPVRIPIGKRLRFEIFKRDDFTCQYCGRHPPEVTLEVDHVVAVSAGGTNGEHNLLTSCADCNRGKSDRPLNAPPRVDLAEKARLIEERREQVLAYEETLSRKRDEDERRIDCVMTVYDQYFDHEYYPSNFSRSSIRNFLRYLPLPIVQEAMDMACDRMPPNRIFKYFCGICWKRIKEPSSGES